jgi:hypothetical protein
VNKKYPIDTPGRIKAAWAYTCPVSSDSQQSSPGNYLQVTGIAVGSPTVAYILFCGLPEAPADL